MNFFERVKSVFSKNFTTDIQNENSANHLKQQAIDIGSVIAPIFREIPPDSKQGKFLSEGLRSWAYIAITAIADEISTSPLNLFRKQKEDWLLIEEHPALALLEKPNGFQTKEEFLWLTSVFLLAEGEAPWYLDNAKNPTQMVLLNPYNLTLLFDNNSIVGSYKYRQSNGVQKEIPKDQIIFLKLPNIDTPFRGMGIMKYIAQTLDIDNFTEEYLKLFFYNDTTPGAVLQTDNELTDNIIKRLKTQFQNRHQGVKNSHRLAVLEKGLKYTKISSNINELQLKELNDLIRDKVLAAYKVPKSVLGIVEDVNRANAEASSYTFSKRAILPKLRLIEGQLNQYLLPKFSEKALWFEFENPAQEDKILQATYWQMAINAGWLTKNEVREELGLEPLELEPLEEEPENDLDNPDNVPDEEEDTSNQDEEKEPKKERKRKTKSQDAFVELMKDIIQSEEPQLKKEYNTEELTKYHNDKVFFVEEVEADYKRDLERNFKRQKKEILSQIQGKSITKGNSLNLSLDEEKEVEMMMKISSPHLMEAIIKESTLANALLGLNRTLTPQDEVVKTFLKARTLKLGKGTTQTTQNAVDKIVKDWAEKGEDWQKLRHDIQEYFEGKGDEGALARAKTIARTEVSTATGFAQKTVYQEAGAVKKVWVTAWDERTCPACSEMDGKVVAIEKNFFDKGDSFVYSDENGKSHIMTFDFDKVENACLHPNCRCDIKPVFDEGKGYNGNYKKEMQAKIEMIKAEEEHIKELAEKEKKLSEKERLLNKKEVELAESIEEFEKLK